MLSVKDKNWIKQYCSRKFRAKHPDYEYIKKAIFFAYKKGLESGMARPPNKANKADAENVASQQSTLAEDSNS